MFHPKGFIESFELSDAKASGMEIDPSKLKATARKKDDEEEGYYDEDEKNPFGEDEDDDDSFSGRRTTILEEEPGAADIGEMIGDEEEVHEEDSSPEKDPLFKKVLEKDRKAPVSNPTQDRLNLIRERAEELKRSRMVSQAPEVLEQEPVVTAPQPATLEGESDTSLTEETMAQDSEEAADLQGEQDLENLENVEEGKRGRKKGQTSEGRQSESDIASVEDLRVAAYDLDAMKDYGIPERKIDKMFDTNEYLKNNKRRSDEEPELWELASEYIDPATKTSINKLESLIDSAYDEFTKLRFAETDVDGEEAGTKEEKLEKTKKKIKDVLENRKKEEIATFTKLDSFNQMEADYMIKYFTNLKKNTQKRVEKLQDKVEILRETKEEDKSNQELAKRILEKEKAGK